MVVDQEAVSGAVGYGWLSRANILSLFKVGMGARWIAAGGSEVPQERVGERVPGERFYGFTLLWIICFAVQLGFLG